MPKSDSSLTLPIHEHQRVNKHDYILPLCLVVQQIFQIAVTSCNILLLVCGIKKKKKEDSIKGSRGKRKSAHFAIFFLSAQESHIRVLGFSAGWILLPSAQGTPAESMAHRLGRTCSCKLYSLNHSEVPDCFMSGKLWHNLLPLFLNVIKAFHNAPHSVSAVSTTACCILHPRMDSGKCKQSKQANKNSLYPLAFFFQ